MKDHILNFDNSKSVILKTVKQNPHVTLEHIQIWNIDIHDE